MTIKYAEITIIINTEKESILNYFNRLLLSDENTTTDNDTIIILFDDGIICDVKKECKNKNINIIMGPRSFKTNSPIYFEIKDKTFFSKSPTFGHNGLRLDCKPIFANNKKHITTKKEHPFGVFFDCSIYRINDVVIQMIPRILKIQTCHQNLLAW